MNRTARTLAFLATVAALASFAACGCPTGRTACGDFCVDLKTDNTNCGACNKACPSGQACSMGACTITCVAGQTACKDQCLDLMTDVANCGACGTACPSGQVCSAGKCAVSCQTGLTNCGGTCRDLKSDVANCGGCGTACPSGQVCSGGACNLTCQTGLTNCGGTCRDLTGDIANCGACGTACPSGQVCAGSMCSVSCQSGLTNCGGTCRDLTSDLANCGACGKSCPTGQVCSSSGCAASCASPLVACAGACVDKRFDPANCGGCGTVCPTPAHATAACFSGACGLGPCSGTFQNCDANASNGCEVDTASDANNCGTCGKACALTNVGTQKCASGACAVGACASGYLDCDHVATNGCEVNGQTDSSNCGGCGTVCPSNKSCKAGVCTLINPTNFIILSTQNVTYSGYKYVVVQFSLNGTSSANATWCDDYELLCQQVFNGSPVGCGPPYNPGSSGYQLCGDMYGSNGVGDTLGCNPSGGVTNAAHAAGYSDATSSNSMGFHYCAGTCTKVWCTGTSCSTSLSYYDPSFAHGYTLCLVQ